LRALAKVSDGEAVSGKKQNGVPVSGDAIELFSFYTLKVV
jgi:hypothetical protein